MFIKLHVKKKEEKQRKEKNRFTIVPNSETGNRYRRLDYYECFKNRIKIIQWLNKYPS